MIASGGVGFEYIFLFLLDVGIRDEESFFFGRFDDDDAVDHVLQNFLADGIDAFVEVFLVARFEPPTRDDGFEFAAHGFYGNDFSFRDGGDAIAQSEQVAFLPACGKAATEAEFRRRWV